MENLKNLEKIAKIFQPQNIITSEEIDQVLKGIMEILASYKKGTDAINEETKAVVNSLLEQTIKYNQETISEFKSEAEKAHAERMKELQGFLSEVKTTLGDMEAMMSEVKDGKDADEERVIDEVINRIKIDPTVVTMSAEEVRDKLASLKDDDRLDKSAIKGLEKVLQQKDLDYAVATLQHQASFLINKGGLKVVSHDASLSGDGTPESPLKVESASGLTLQTDGVANGSQTLLNLVAGTNVTLTDNGTGSVTIDATGGSGSPGGSTTQLQYNNAGAFGGISGATTNGTAVTYTTGNLIATDVKASGSGGLHLHNNTGQDCFLSGVGGGINNTAYGALKADYATATTVPYFDASKNLISSAVTPTELGYLSGVTSAIQTQLNAKEDTSNKSTSTSLGTSDTLYPTQNAVKVYVDNAVTGLLDLKGDTDCSTNPNYPSALKGDAYYVTVAGKIGGASGKTVEVGDVYVAKADNAGGTEASVGTSWFVLNQNLSGVALTSGTLAQFASTTSSQLAGVISDETGSGSLVFGTDPTFTTRINVPEVKATSSAGVDVHNNSGTQVALFGAGGSTGTSLVGTTNIGSASADYIQIAGNTGSTTQTATGSSTNININLVPKGTGRLQANAVNVPTVSSTDTLTNKRITKRVGTTTSSATPTINTDNVDMYTLTAQTVDITSFTTNLSGTPTDGQTLWIAITGTAARAITWGASFEASTVALPTTTVSTNRLDVGFVWNAATSKWRCIASA